LLESGWRILVVWECALRGSTWWLVEEVLGRCDSFVRGRDETFTEIGSNWPVGLKLDTPKNLSQFSVIGDSLF